MPRRALAVGNSARDVEGGGGRVSGRVERMTGMSVV